MVRVTREKLIDLARKEAERRGQTEDVISGYIIGSVANGEPLINDTADIDLILIHQFEPVRQRELIPLSENIHFDIIHHGSELYNHPPALRLHPWLGPAICEPVFLYDPEHFFERAQAGVRGQFYQINNTHARSTAFLESARRYKSAAENIHSWVSNYAKAIRESINALVTLGGFPIAGRKMGLILQERLREMGLEEHFKTFLKLQGGDIQSWDPFPDWLLAWEKVFNAAGNISPAFNPTRKNYYLQAFRDLYDSDHSEPILWHLITTWDQAMGIIRNAAETSEFLGPWEEVLTQLKLSPQFRTTRNAELEDHLDVVEEMIEKWA
jgi:hypothetical protein